MGAMTVRELIDLLTELPPAAIVVLAKDAEGNDFSPLPENGCYSVGGYVAHNTWSGEFIGAGDVDDDWNEDDPDGEMEDCAEYEEPEVAEEAVCLWPTN